MHNFNFFFWECTPPWSGDSDSSDFTGLETLKFKNPPFQHILMYYPVEIGNESLWYIVYMRISEIPIFSHFHIYIWYMWKLNCPCLLNSQLKTSFSQFGNSVIYKSFKEVMFYELISVRCMGCHWHPMLFQPKSNGSNFGQKHRILMGAHKSDRDRLVQHYFL